MVSEQAQYCLGMLFEVLILNFHSGINIDFWLSAFCTVCEVYLQMLLVEMC
jgi:hypothetical protein